MIAKAHLTAQEERELIALSQQGDIEARNKLVERNYGFIWQQAIRHAKRHPQVDIENLIGPAVLAYIQAINKFKLGLRLRLTTYATCVMSTCLVKACREEVNLIKVPPMWSIKKGSERVKEDANRAMYGVVSMDQAAKGDHGDESVSQHGLSHDVAARPEPEPDLDARPCLGNLTKALPERLQFIIARKLAGMTHSKIGAEMGITKERVRQLYHDALEILRREAQNESQE